MEKLPFFENKIIVARNDCYIIQTAIVVPHFEQCVVNAQYAELLINRHPVVLFFSIRLHMFDHTSQRFNLYGPIKMRSPFDQVCIVDGSAGPSRNQCAHRTC